MDEYEFVKEIANKTEIIDEIFNYCIDNAINYPPYQLCKNVLIKYVYDSLDEELMNQYVEYKLHNAIGAEYLNIPDKVFSKIQKLDPFVSRPAKDAKEFVIEDCYFVMKNIGNEGNYKVKGKKDEYRLLQFVARVK